MLSRAPLSRTVKLISGTLTAALFVLCCAAPALAQDTTPAATLPVIVITATPTVPSPTPTVTPTPTLTPTPTATFTALQARMALGRAYLQGGDYGNAAEIFSAVALEDRGSSEALAGLDAALKGQAAATAAAAPHPTVEPAAAPTPSGPTPAGAFLEKVWTLGATALVLLLILLALYLAARALRWLLSWLRELWFTRIRKPPVPPGLVIGEIIDATGEDSCPAARVAVQALTEQLVIWNSAAPRGLRTPLQVDGLNRPGLAWVRALWEQIFPPRRAYRLTGLLAGKQPGPYRLSLDRVDLRSNRVDASRTFESGAETPAQAFRELGSTAAFWAHDPLGMEGMPGLLEMPARAGLTGAARSGVQPTPTQTANEALRLLAQVRAQVQGINVDYATAPHTLDEAQTLIERLPAGSVLRGELQLAADDLLRAVQPGRAPK
jgi:hypothetical protein